MVSYISPIDPHVHLRWTEYSNNDFLGLAFRDANEVGLKAMIEQPNTVPHLTHIKNVEDRILHVDNLRKERGYMNIEHFMHVAMTPDSAQRAEAINMIKNHPRVVSGKTFYVHSTKSGAIEITDAKIQKEAWQQKVLLAHDGTEIGHFEEASQFSKGILFDYNDPRTHSLHQSAIAEQVSLENQFKFAYDAKFKGNFVVLHTSSPFTIELGERLVNKHNPEFKLYFETTFHHMFLNADDDYSMHGNRVKMNPPLRSRKLQERLLEYVLAGRTHIIGTDHAPHPIERKQGENPASGIPAIAFWPKGIQLLQKAGIKQNLLDDLIFHNSNKIYNLRLTGTPIEAEYEPELWRAYGFNPFLRVDRN